MNGQLACRRRRRWPPKLETVQAYLFLLPTLIGLVLFNLVPIIASGIISFTNWDILTEARFVGFQNYRTLAADSLFQAAFKNTFYYTFVSVPLLIVIPFGLALMLNQKIRGTVFFRTCFFMPVVTSTVAVSTVWFWIYNSDFGLINLLIYQILGVAGPNWLGSAQWAMPAIIIMSVWKSAGYNMVIFLAGLQGIPKNLYESASIDGVTSWQKLRYITIPLVSPTTFFVLIMTMINSFQVFEQTYMLTKGGPHYATLSMVYYTYQQSFEYFRMGYASAMAWVLFMVTMAFTFIQMYFQKKWVRYV